MDNLELEFKRWFLKKWTGWSESYEPRSGSGVGLPDTQLLVRGIGGWTSDCFLLPVEFKIGEKKEDRIFASKIRPAQVRWHFKFHQAGGKAIIMIGVRIGEEWHPYYLRPRATGDLRNWQDGWTIGEGCALFKKFGRR